MMMISSQDFGMALTYGMVPKESDGMALKRDEGIGRDGFKRQHESVHIIQVRLTFAKRGVECLSKTWKLGII